MDVQLAAGTVYLDVLVWQATISTAEASSERVPVQTGHAALYRLKGHDGSIHRRASFWIALAFKPNSIFFKQGFTSIYAQSSSSSCTEQGQLGATWAHLGVCIR